MINHTEQLAILAEHGITGDDATTALTTFNTKLGRLEVTTNQLIDTPTLALQSYFGADAGRVATILINHARTTTVDHRARAEQLLAQAEAGTSDPDPDWLLTAVLALAHATLATTPQPQRVVLNRWVQGPGDASKFDASTAHRDAPRSAQ